MELPEGATHIAIDENGDIYAYYHKPTSSETQFNEPDSHDPVIYLGTILGKAKFTLIDQ